MHFSPRHYASLKSRLRRKYQSRLKAISKALKKFPTSKSHLWFKDHADELTNFSPERWYFLKQVESLLFFLGSPVSLGTKGVFGTKEDEVFERWNKSEFADVFLKQVNRGFTLGKASQRTAKILDQHTVALGNRHLLKNSKLNKSYRPQPSLGDLFKQKKLSKLLATTLHLEGKDLVLMTSSLKEMKDFSQKIDVALKIIRLFSPDSWERFSAFTETIVPINQREFVSYSHQELPGTSMINLYHRDFVDLLDDLLHENGHHHLNYYLNLQKLIEEPVDCIYYSPWRRTLRPLRGIYHAYFTFFWAFKLFSDLNESELDTVWHIFRPQEKEKILWRAIEEFWMLDYTFQDLAWARKQKLISDSGWDLIKEQQKFLTKAKKKIPLWERRLKAHKADLRELKNTLKEARRTYRKH